MSAPTADLRQQDTPEPTSGRSYPLSVSSGSPLRVLDVFCGVGGWSKSFAKKGWHCTGVDIAELGYPFDFVKADALTLEREWINGFDAVVMSPPCEEYARAWLPWLRGDHKPAQWAVDLLEWAVALSDRPGRLVECSHFGARHVPGSVRRESYALWGDVPLLMPVLPRGKMAKSGMRPELRAAIPPALADTVADWFTVQLLANTVSTTPR